MNRTFICSMQYYKIFFYDDSLYIMPESISLASCDSCPLFELMKSALNFIFENVIKARDKK